MHVVELVENEDGSANMSVSLSEQETETLLEYAVVKLLKEHVASKEFLKDDGTIDSNVTGVCRKLIDRSKKGVAKYGCTTDREDLEPLDWLQHLQEELMDACVYIERLKKEI